MKKFLAILAVALLWASSCSVDNGQFVYHVTVDFNDNQGIFVSAMDAGFQEAGFTQTHHWAMQGKRATCHAAAVAAFRSRIQAVDQDPSLMEKPLDLQGRAVTLNYQSGNESGVLDVYYFVH